MRTNELFDLEDKIILYDLTNMYFEGRKAGSDLAGYGRNKEKRSDAPPVTLTLVVNVKGFVKYSHIYQGNITDCKTLGTTLTDLNESASLSGRKPIVVIDAGIATEDNMKLVESEGYPYVCISRPRLKDYLFCETERCTWRITMITRSMCVGLKQRREGTNIYRFTAK